MPRFYFRIFISLSAFIFLQATAIAQESVDLASFHSEICEGLKLRHGQAKTNFQGQAHPLAQLPKAESCSFSKSMGGSVSALCYWTFALRNQAASEARDALSHSIDRCMGSTVFPPQNSQFPVNHPDSFDQRIQIYDGVPISLSIKDKSALGKTFVFLRIDGVP